MNKKYEEFVGCLRHELMDRLGLGRNKSTLKSEMRME